MDFDEKFEGLIGIDLLKEIQATIDLPRRQIITPKGTIPKTRNVTIFDK